VSSIEATGSWRAGVQVWGTASADTMYSRGEERLPQSTKHRAGGRTAKIATFDIKIESMRFAPRSAAKGAGKAGLASCLRVGGDNGEFLFPTKQRSAQRGRRSGMSVASARGSVVDHTESVSNHAGSQQPSA
jgi:hypothetical protein